MQVRSGQFGPVTPAWVTMEGPSSDTAVSTRARLARNVHGIPFPSRAREADFRRVADLVLDAVRQADGRFGRLHVIYPARLSEFDRLALVNTRLASRQHVTAGRFRPIVLNEAGTLSLMVNEEDHLRIQCILPGLQPMAALQMAQEFDRYLAGKITYARADNYGYLVTSLGNIGTGLRLSVMLHVAGLVFQREAVQVLSAAAELKTSVRGLFGEGTKAFGDIFQVSNETPIGFSEKEIAARVRAAAEHLISREREARRVLAAEHLSELSEAVERAKSLLIEAHVLSSREAMAYLSILRLGAELGLEPSLSPRTFNELLVSMQVGLSAAEDITTTGTRAAESVGSDVKRAKLVRKRLTERFEA